MHVCMHVYVRAHAHKQGSLPFTCAASCALVHDDMAILNNLTKGATGGLACDMSEMMPSRKRGILKGERARYLDRGLGFGNWCWS